MADETYPKTYYRGISVDGWLKAGFIKGYNKAKEKYRFTEEDMIKAFIEGTNYGSAYQSCIENEDWNDFMISLAKLLVKLKSRQSLLQIFQILLLPFS